MQKLLRKFFESLEPPSAQAPQARSLALAVLLHELARADFEHAEPEFAAIREALAAHSGLDAAALGALMAQAGEHARRAVSLHHYVETLNRELLPADKRALMASLWAVAYADGRLDPLEEQLLRRLADLLYVPHRDYIATKLAAAERVARG